MFLNREEAGIRLALLLSREKSLSNPIIVAIPRGGVVIGKVLSDILKMPLAILIVKKIGAPNNPELALGAVGSAGEPYWDMNIVESLGIDKKTRETLLAKTKKQVIEREEKFGIGFPDVGNKEAIVVDDGVATGATAIAAGIILKGMGASKVILATPLISRRTKRTLSDYFDKIIAVLTPLDFSSVGGFYKEFPQVEDEKVKELLRGAFKK